MSCTVPHYWEEHVHNLSEKLSVVAQPRHRDTEIIVSEDGLEGIIDSRIFFDDGAFIDVIEHVQITDRPHRLQYRYELVVDDEEVERIEFDPDLDEEMQHHRNRPLPDGRYTHEPLHRISLKEFVEDSWSMIHGVRELREMDSSHDD